MSDTSLYKLKLTGPGLSLERDVSQSLANKIAMLILSGSTSEQERKSNGGGAPADKGAGGIDNTSAREYLTDSGAKTNPQKMTVLGHYILETDGKERFSLKELLVAFSDAKEGEPGNPNRDLTTAIQKGWISGKNDSYLVTGTGMQAIENHFTKAAGKGKKDSSKS